MKKLLAIAFALGICIGASANIQVPKGVHPRLYITESEIPALRERMQTPQGQEILRLMEANAVPRTAMEEGMDSDRGFRFYFKMRGLTSKVQLQALDYLTTGNKQAATEAITSMLDSLQHTKFGRKNDLSRASGVMLMTGAIIYDWCYPEFTQDQRLAYIKEFKRIAGTMECGYPPKDSEPIAGHNSEWMILRDLMAAGIAVYDEDPEIMDYVDKLISTKYIDARNYFYNGHNYHQGTSYVNVRFSNDLIAQWTVTKMTGKPLFSTEQQYVLYDFIYRRRPDGQYMPAGDTNPAPRKKKASQALPMMLASSYYNDPYLAYDYEIRPEMEPHCLILELLWRNFDLKGKAPDDLPLSKYSPAPFGWMIARTGWGENSVICEMKVNEQFVGNHQHLDGGAFQIYYKGPLAIDSGSYQGSSGGYNSPHNKNYFKRTIAHNSLLIYDPDEKFACHNYGGADKTPFAANDGGQRMPGDGWDTCRSFEQLMSEDYTMGKALAHAFIGDTQTPDASYLKGDLTKAYSSKVSDVKRSFVFLNFKDDKVPAALVVYDHIVSAKPDFKKTWLLHSIEEPEIGAGSFIVKRTKNNDSGQLRDDVLLPAKATIEKIGGKGKEFWVNGKNYENKATTRPDPCNERGAWRVEVSPAAANTEDCMLNVIQVGDDVANIYNKAQLVSNGNFNSTVIKNFVVLFAKDSKQIEGKGGCKLSHKGEATIIVTDLAAGQWQIKRNGRILEVNGQQAVTVKTEEGVLSFKGASGTYEFVQLP